MDPPVMEPLEGAAAWRSVFDPAPGPALRVKQAGDDLAVCESHLVAVASNTGQRRPYGVNS